MKVLRNTQPPGICILIMLVFSFAAAAQQHNLHYKLLKGNDTVGELTVVDTRHMTKRIIKTDLKAEVPAILFYISLIDHKSAVYNDHVLQSAIVIRNLIKGRTDRSITLLKDNRYTDGRTLLPGIAAEHAIDFSMTMLYTTEPIDKKSIYSEFHQQIVPIIKIRDHEYRIKTPDGQTGYYYYEKGLCVKIETKTTLATIQTILVNNSIALK